MDRTSIFSFTTTGLMTLANTSYAAPVVYKDSFLKSEMTEGMYFNNPVTYQAEENRLENRLNELVQIKDDWDGQGAISPLQITIENVKKILNNVQDSHLKLLDEEDIVPSPYGTVSLYFEDAEENELSIEIGKDLIGLSGEINGVEIIIDNIQVSNIEFILEKLNLLESIS